MTTMVLFHTRTDRDTGGLADVSWPFRVVMYARLQSQSFFLYTDWRGQNSWTFSECWQCQRSSSINSSEIFFHKSAAVVVFLSSGVLAVCEKKKKTVDFSSEARVRNWRSSWKPEILSQRRWISDTERKKKEDSNPTIVEPRRGLVGRTWRTGWHSEDGSLVDDSGNKLSRPM